MSKIIFRKKNSQESLQEGFLNLFHVGPANHLDICSCAGNFSGLVFALHGKHLGINPLLIIQTCSQFEVSEESLPLLQMLFQSGFMKASELLYQ